MEAFCGIDALCAQARATDPLVLFLKPSAGAPPLAPAAPPAAPPASRPASPALHTQALARTRATRACVCLAQQRILDTLEWENCGEESGHFRAVAQQFNEAFDNEDLEAAEMEEVSSLGSYLSCSASDDNAYKSSFVTDSSGSENEGDSDDSEHDWRPTKKMRVRRDSTNDPVSSDDAHDAPAENEADVANQAPEGADVASHASAEAPAPPHPHDAVEPPEALAPLELYASAEPEQAAPQPEPAAQLCPEPGAVRYLHAEALDSPVGFYNLWVL